MCLALSLANSKRTPNHQGPGPCPVSDPGEVSDEPYPHRTVGARSERRRPGALSSGPPDPGIVWATGAHAGRAARNGAPDMMAWAGRRLWLVVRTVIRAVQMAHHEQVRMWECILETSGAAPLTAAGPLRWVRSLDGYRLAGSHLPAQDPAETGR
jgi:hypothetical protein